MKNVIGTIFCCGWAMFCSHAADFQLTEITRETNGIAIQWNAETGNRYEVQSAALVEGPWRSRGSVEAGSASAKWVDTEMAAQQFYRVAIFPNTGDALSRAGLLAGDFVPKNVAFLGEQSGEIGANAVFLASQIGAGGARLVTTGTLTQQGQNWTYAAPPNDRLVVQFATGAVVTFYITRMEGDFSIDAATFLRQNHIFDYRSVVPGVSDLTFTSAVGSGTANLHATARGTLVWSNVTYTVNLTLAGDYRFEIDSTGSSLLNDYTTAGTVSAPGYSLNIDQRRRFELVVVTVNFGGATRTESATTDQDWYNHTLTIGADSYKWVNATKQKSFKNGKPSSTDTYWKASGGVFKNGGPYGSYQMRSETLAGYLRFYLVLPNELIELEAWRK